MALPLVLDLVPLMHDQKGSSDLKHIGDEIIRKPVYDLEIISGIYYQILTMDSFIPILVSSSISRRSDMWLPIPILLFICASACCQNKMEGIQKMLGSRNEF